jgi:hypothetical protein
LHIPEPGNAAPACVIIALTAINRLTAWSMRQPNRNAVITPYRRDGLALGRNRGNPHAQAVVAD